MTFLKRFFLFGLVNILVIVTLSFFINILGLSPRISSDGNLLPLFLFCLVWGMGGAFISLFLSKFMAKHLYGVQIIGPDDYQYRDIVSMVHRFAEQSGIEKMPEVGVYESDDINAFATGPTKNNALVAVSTGLLRRMDREEVSGVIAHEVAHIANGDMVTMTLVQGVINAFVMFLARIVAHIIDQSLRSNNDREGGGLGGLARFFVIMILEVIFGLLGSIVVAYFSRWREYRADAGSAQINGKSAMINALKALKRSYEMIPDEKNGLAAMKISSKNSWFQLFSTHPSLDERIAALEKLP